MTEKIDVELIGLIKGKNDAGRSQGGVGNYSTQFYKHLKQSEEVNVQHKELNLSLPVLESTAQSLFEVPYKILKSDADVIHLLSQQYTMGLFMLSEKYLENVVVTVHNTLQWEKEYARDKDLLYGKFYGKGLEKVGHIISVSEFTKKELIDKLGVSEEHITVIYQGIDQTHFKFNNLTKDVADKYGIERPYVMYAGAETKRKSLFEVLKLYKDLKAQEEDLKFVKVRDAGKEKNRDKTLSYIEKLGLNREDVIFTGFVEQEDLPKVYSGALANILVSDYEGFGRSTLEAEACGTTTLTHDKPPMNEYLPEDRWKNHDLDLKREPAEIPEWQDTVRETIRVYQSL